MKPKWPWRAQDMEMPRPWDVCQEQLQALRGASPRDKLYVLPVAELELWGYPTSGIQAVSLELLDTEMSDLGWHHWICILRWSNHNWLGPRFFHLTLGMSALGHWILEVCEVGVGSAVKSTGCSSKRKHHTAAHNCVHFQFQGILTPSHRHTCRQNTNVYKINNKLLKTNINN